MKTHLQDWTKVTSENCWQQGHLGLQGSYKFLEPNFKTFSRFFFQNNKFFLQTQGYQIGDQQRPWKTQEPGFSHDVLQTYSNHGAKRSLERSGNSHCVIKRGKKLHLLSTSWSFCFRLSLYFPDFFQVWKIAKIFKNSRLCKNPVGGNLHQIALFPNRTDPSVKQKITGEQGKRQVGKNKRNLQFLGVSTVSKTNFNIWQVSPVWAGRQRNITHAYCNKGIHFLADVIFKDWLVLVTADLVNNNIKNL